MQIKTALNEKDSGIYYLTERKGYTSELLIKEGVDYVGELSEVIRQISSIIYNVKDLGEIYPFKISGIDYTANSFEELLGYVVYDYDTINIIDSKYYAPNELKIIEDIQRYQREVGAKLEILKDLKDITDEDVLSYSHKKVRYILNKKVRKNSGIFYVPSLLSYTSTHLYNNYKKEKGIRVGAGCNYKRVREFGSLKDIVPKTLWLYDKSKVKFYYPYIINGVKGFNEDKESLYETILNNYVAGFDFKLVNERVYYSRQTKRNMKYLLKYLSE